MVTRKQMTYIQDSSLELFPLDPKNVALEDLVFTQESQNTFLGSRRISRINKRFDLFYGRGSLQIL